MKRSLLLLLLFTLLLSACKPGGITVVTQPAATERVARPYPEPEVTKPSLPPTARLPRTEPTNLPPTQPITPTETLAPSGWSGPLPVLTADNQGLTFGPGQLVTAFADGFTPGETVAIALIHDQTGAVANKTALADSLGRLLTVRRLKQNASETEALPEGHYVFELSGAAQTRKLSFFVDYRLRAATFPKACGFYPKQAVFNGYQVFFCGGLSANAAYTLLSKQGAAFDQATNTADYSGLAVFPLIQSSDTLSPGTWTVTLGSYVDDQTPPVLLDLPAMTVEILPEENLP